MSKREGKYFNMGVDAAADQLKKSIEELRGLIKDHSELDQGKKDV